MAEDAATYWDRTAACYRGLGRAGFWRRHRRALVADLQPSRVLEVCCGGGQLVVDLLASGHDAFGEDLSPTMVARAQEGLRGAGLDPQRVRRGDVTRIDHPDDTFDVVVCTGAVGLLDPASQRRALAEMARVSRDRVLLLEPLEQRPGLYPGRVLGWFADGQRPVPPAALEAAGLTVLRGEPVMGGAFSLVDARVRPSVPAVERGRATRTSAVVAARHGGPEVLAVGPWSVPVPWPDQVVVRVEAAGISHADLLVCQGLHPERRRAPFVPGWDVVGVVERVGPGVRSVEVGQRVAGLTIVGGWAGHAALRASWAVPVPAAVSSTDAVCLVMDYVVAHQMLTRTARLEAGSTVLVQGVGGGVGTALLQVAARQGVRVIGTDHGERRAHVEALGGTLIDIDSEDVPRRCRELTGGRGVDAAFDGIGVTVPQSWQALRSGGQLVWFGMAAFLAHGRADPARTVRTLAAVVPRLLPVSRTRRASLYSIQTTARRHPDRYRHDLALLLDQLARGELRPSVSRIVALEEVPAALAALARGQVYGKQVIRPTSQPRTA
jgi:NADPH:quinone reductase-like Zn-dependent oxidoreductase